MTGNNPLHTITTVAKGAVQLAAGVAGTAAGTVKQAISGDVDEQQPEKVSSDSEQAEATAAGEADNPTAATEASEQAADGGGKQHPEPVNVVEQLGLDPAPVPEPKPNTSIDAAADPDAVDVTPADVAKVVGKGDTPD